MIRFQTRGTDIKHCRFRLLSERPLVRIQPGALTKSTT
jgi:hypothetical protein